MKYAIIAFMFFMLLLGCTSEWKTIATPGGSESDGKSGSATPGQPSKIGYLDVSQQYDTYDDSGAGDWYDVSFTLEDSDGNVVTDSGKGVLKIKDQNNVTLYTKNFDIETSEFEEKAGYPFYDNKVYAHKAYFSEISKSNAYYATFELEFTTSEGKKLTSSKSNVYLASSLYNSSYGSGYGYAQKNLTSIDKTVQNNNVELKLVKGGIYGSFKDYELVTEIKNTGTVKKEITIREATLVTGGKQFSAEISSYSKDLGNIFPGAAVDKTFTFYNVGSVGKDATFYLELLVVEGGEADIITLQVNFKP